MTKSPLRIGTRASALARWQAQWVARRLSALDVEVELVLITTRGDTSKHEAVANIGAPGVFTKELQRALLDDRIDVAVHSMKDLPTDAVDRIALAAVPKRESPHDVLVSRLGRLDALPQGARIGTGSLRRRAQLLHVRPDLQMCDVRGNVDTRLDKLASGQYDALVLAEAGLVRLGLQTHITQVFEPDVMLPAVAQGALAIEARVDDRGTRALLAELDDRAAHAAVLAERACLAALEGGCLAPIAAWGRLAHGGRLQLDGAVLGADGRRRIAASAAGDLDDPRTLGGHVAEQLLGAGAGELIRDARQGR